VGFQVAKKVDEDTMHFSVFNTARVIRLVVNKIALAGIVMWSKYVRVTVND
jgi:hypothetical protein